jgi:poly(A) polymerase
MLELIPITPERIDADAVKVVRRLNKYGYEAFFVGGCVRDLLLGRRPKDFDVSTNATPSEIKKIFRNCRIIGRRFRLAHIFFNTKIIETATFRAAPLPDPEGQEGELLIRRDNIFGTAEEDARRRDFTVNGLFFELAHNRIIDYVGGQADLQTCTIRTIGDPRIRFQEDPVRILRAIKFAARLSFQIEPQTLAALVEFRGLITQCSSARVLEEIYRLLACGAAAPTFQHLHQTGVLAVLFPEIWTLLDPPSNPLACTEVCALQARPTPLPLVTEEERPRDEEPDPLSGPDAGPEPQQQDLPALFSAWLAKLEPEYDFSAELSPLHRQLGAHLEVLDQWLTSDLDHTPSHALLLDLLFLPLVQPIVTSALPVQQATEMIEELVDLMCARLQISRKDREQAKKILASQRRLIQRGRRSRPYVLINRDFFPDALLLLELHHQAVGGYEDTLSYWRQLMEGQHAGPGRKRRRHPPRSRHSSVSGNH